MSVSIFHVAEAFLSFGSMTHKKLQKLCYYSQAWYLALENKRLFEDAHFEAWIHGPVSPQLYSRYREHGWVEIPQTPVPSIFLEQTDVLDYLQEIYGIYGRLDGDQLEQLTHSEQPWMIARSGLSPWEGSNTIIDEGIMRRFYLAEYERSQND